MEEDLFQLRQLPVVKFRRTGESARSEDDTASGEHEVQIEGVRAGLEAVELDDGAAVPKEFANPTDDTFMVEDAVEAIGFGKFQWKLSVLTGLAWASISGLPFTLQEAPLLLNATGFPWFTRKDTVPSTQIRCFNQMADAMEMMILSILAPQLHCEWRLPSWQVALLTSVVFVGMMSSSTLWGNISDQYGRKTVRRPLLCMCPLGHLRDDLDKVTKFTLLENLGLKISVLWTLYYGILSAFAPVYSWILVLRGLVGFGIGGVPQSVTLYAEFLPMKARAKCILLIEVFWAIGTVFEVILAVFVMPSLGWRWLLILSAVPLLLFAVLCFVGIFVYEISAFASCSPAIHYILWLPESARYDVLSGNQEKAIATLKRIATENGAPMPLGKLIISRQEDRGKMRDLFTPHFRWTTLLLWFIWFSNAFSYYGLVLLTTELFQAGDVCSISSRKKAVEAKCSLACEYLSKEDYMDLLWTTLSEFPGVLVTLWIIDRLGRKKTMALCFVIFSFCSLLLFICVGSLASCPLSQLSFLIPFRVYPTATRALGLGTCSGMARVGALITPFIAQVMLESSVYLTLAVYSGCCLLAALASCFLPIETKGRGLQESSHREWGQEMVGRGTHGTGVASDAGSQPDTSQGQSVTPSVNDHQKICRYNPGPDPCETRCPELGMEMKTKPTAKAGDSPAEAVKAKPGATFPAPSLVRLIGSSRGKKTVNSGFSALDFERGPADLAFQQRRLRGFQ
ncbi:synaptic vesicle 2-related protein [Camelus ferus]|nr:synaptic vesicle 2-related protein [Camelus ferus]